MMVGDKGFRYISNSIIGGLGALQALGLTIKIKDVNNENNVYEPEVFYGKHLDLLHSISALSPLIPGTQHVHLYVIHVLIIE